jgi:ABC-type transport system involved in cytochrome bd biosynthesis fused ATPase/permease subunit
MGSNAAAKEVVVDDDSVQVTGLQFAYPGQAPFITDFSLHLKPGSRCLLIGANGSGLLPFPLSIQLSKSVSFFFSGWLSFREETFAARMRHKKSISVQQRQMVLFFLFLP